MRNPEIARTQFLVSIYGATRGSSSKFVDMWSVGALLGASRSATRDVVEYLVAEGLLEVVALGGVLRLTDAAIKEIEAARIDETKGTPHLAPLSLINAANAHHPQIDSADPEQPGVPVSESPISFDAEQLHYILEEVEEIVRTAALSNKESVLHTIDETKTLLHNPATPVPKLKAEVRMLRARLRDSGLASTFVLDELEGILQDS